MFLTRMGWNTKMIITGDMTQIDLPKEQKNGLKEALHILGKVEGISVINLSQKDIVRHKLVTRIVNAFEAFDKVNDQEREERRQKPPKGRRNQNLEEEYTILENSDNDFN